jgi:hypothetical protein
MVDEPIDIEEIMSIRVSGINIVRERKNLLNLSLYNV